MRYPLYAPDTAPAGGGASTPLAAATPPPSAPPPSAPPSSTTTPPPSAPPSSTAPPPSTTTPPPTSTPPPPTAPLWDADHWRGTWAGDDAKKKAFAERHTDMTSVADSAYAASQKIAELSTIAKGVLPKDATPEQITQYRKDNGIPEKPEAYLDALPADVKASLADQDKAIITPYLAKLQELNIPPGTAAQLIALRQTEVDRQINARTVADSSLRTQTEDLLRQEWGNNYRAEINNINGFLSGYSEEVREAFLQARTPDGNPLVGTPAVIKALAQMARTIAPYSIPIGSDGGSLDQKGVDARIAELEGWMGAPRGSENYKRYYNDPKISDPKTGEYVKLVDARLALQKRTAA